MGYKVLILFILIYPSFGYSLSEIALFHRCYSHLTGEKAAPQNIYLKKVEDFVKLEGGKNAVDTCMEILESANLNITSNKMNNITPLSKKVLKNMNYMHKAIMGSEDFRKFSDPVETLNHYITHDIFNPFEPALFFSYSLFRDDIPFSFVFNSPKGLRAIRSKLRNENAPNQQAFQLAFIGKLADHSFKARFQTSVTGEGGNSGPLEHEFEYVTLKTQGFGELIGIGPDNEKNIVPSYDNGLRRYGSKLDKKEMRNPGPYDINQHYDGGILGSKGFIITFFGLRGFIHVDGGVHTPRRLGKAILNKLLGLELPAVYESDASAFVDANSPYPFRKGTSCMQCHVTMDRVGYLYRDIKMVLSAGYQDPEHRNTRAFFPAKYIDKENVLENSLTTVSETVAWPVDDDIFQYRPAKGVLYFRDWQGNLINKEVTSRANLGYNLSQLDQPYINIASKYFEYFTGIKTYIADLNLNPIPDNEYKKKNIKYRNFVIKLGQDLKNDPDQNLKILIKKIISSNAYKYPGKGVQ